MPRSLHGPRDAITRKVLLYPANSEEPRITDMEFNEEGGHFKYPVALYTTGLDLRNTYGKYMPATRSQLINVTDQPADLKQNEGEYVVFFNIDVRLPLNLSMARVAEINPKKPGARPTWRGDVIITKEEEWPGPLVIGGGAHRNYLDVDVSLRGCFELFVKYWYQSEDWRNLVENEKFFAPRPEHGHLSTAALGVVPFDPKKFESDVKRFEKNARMIERLDKHLDKQAARISRNNQCAKCDSEGNPDLRVCGRCHTTKYCSRDCQKADWKHHKRECKREV